MTTQELGRNRTILLTVGVMLALLLAALDQTIVGTAMPRIIADLNGFDRYAWVTTAYLVTSTVIVPVAGKLGDLFGRKPFILLGMAGFMAFSWACGLSQDMNQLILFRGLQGLFGGVLFASVFTVLADIFPPRTRTRMQGVFGGVFGLASVIGPAAGGYITDHWTWRWVFYVNIPVGVVGFALLLALLPYVRSRSTWRDIDFAGAFLIMAGLVPIMISLSNTSTYGWGSWQTLVPLIGGVLLLVAFAVVEHFEAEPIVPLALFKNRAFTVSVLVGMLSGFGMFGAIIFVPLVFQGVLGVSATNSGALITPMMFGLIGASVISGQLMVRIRDYKWLGTIGSVVMAAGIYILSLVSVNSTQAQVTFALVVTGAGLGITFPLYLNAVQSAVEKRYLGVVSSNMQFFRNLGGTIATAIFGSILANRLGPNIQAKIDALHLPPAFATNIKLPKGTGGAQQLFNAANIAHQRAALPPAARPLFDQVMLAVKQGLAATMHEVFGIALVFVIATVVVTVFMPSVPLLAAKRQPGAALGEAPPVPVTEDEAEAAAV